MEVRTPILDIGAGGANADPFVTHHNEMNLPMYLRIAPELALKQLVIGGKGVSQIKSRDGVRIGSGPEKSGFL